MEKSALMVIIFISFDSPVRCLEVLDNAWTQVTYRITMSRLTHEESIKDCDDLGGYLAPMDSVYTDHLLQVIDHLYNQKDSEIGPLFKFWVGIHYVPENKQWIKSHDSSVFPENLVKKLKLPDQPSKLCVALKLITQQKWGVGVFNCSEPHRAVCRFDLGNCTYLRCPGYSINSMYSKVQLGELSKEGCENECNDHNNATQNCAGFNFNQYSLECILQFSTIKPYWEINHLKEDSDWEANLVNCLDIIYMTIASPPEELHVYPANVRDLCSPEAVQGAVSTSNPYEDSTAAQPVTSTANGRDMFESNDLPETTTVQPIQLVHSSIPMDLESTLPHRDPMLFSADKRQTQQFDPTEDLLDDHLVSSDGSTEHSFRSSPSLPISTDIELVNVSTSPESWTQEIILQSSFEFSHHASVDTTVNGVHSTSYPYRTDHTLSSFIDYLNITTPDIVDVMNPQTGEASTRSGAYSLSSSPEEPCMCVCGRGDGFTLEEKKAWLSEIVSNLTIDVKKTNNYMRRYVSVDDPRPTARGCGYVAIAILSSVLALLLLTDSISMCTYFNNWRHRLE